MRLPALGVVGTVGLIGVVLFSADVPAQKTGGYPKSRATQRGKAPRPAQSRPGTIGGVSLKSLPADIGPRGNILQYDPGTPIFPVTVDSGLVLDEPTLTTYQLLANQLSGYEAVPNARLTFYSAFVNSPDYTVVGWQGLVENVEADPSGDIVTVAVLPAFDAAAAFVIKYSEQFLVGNDGSIQYLGSTFPAELAGQFPDEFEEY